MKRILAALLAVTVCLSFAACASADDDNDTGNKKKPEPSVAETETADVSSKPEESEPSSEESSSEEEKDSKAETTTAKKKKKPKETTEEKKEEPEVEMTVYSTDYYSAEFNGVNWYTETESDVDPEIIGMFGTTYYYRPDADSAFQSRMDFGLTLPDFFYGQDFEEFGGITDQTEILGLIYNTRMENFDYIDVLSSEIVEHSGVRMSLVRTYTDYGDSSFYTDMYMFIYRDAYCEIFIEYLEENDAKAEFEQMLDSLTFK